jgi:elongation factor P
MLSYTDIKKGVVFVYEGQPYEVIEAGFLRMQQRKAVMQTKLRNLVNGKIIDRNWQASDEFEEAEVERKNAVFIYESRGEYWFTEEGNPKNRFALTKEVIGESARFLKPNVTVQTTLFNDKVITVTLPVKMDFVVTEAPPAIKGNTAQGGTKIVELEGGAKISVPLFINTDDVVRVNTATGDYVERVDKS